MSDALLGEAVKEANGNWSRPNAGTAYASAWNPGALDGTGKLLAGILSGMAAGTAAAAMAGANSPEMVMAVAVDVRTAQVQGELNAAIPKLGRPVQPAVRQPIRHGFNH